MFYKSQTKFILSSQDDILSQVFMNCKIAVSSSRSIVAPFFVVLRTVTFTHLLTLVDRIIQRLIGTTDQSIYPELDIEFPAFVLTYT